MDTEYYAEMNFIHDKELEKLRKRLEQAKELLEKYNYKASCCGEFMKDGTVQKLWEETNKFLNAEIFKLIEEQNYGNKRNS